MIRFLTTRQFPDESIYQYLTRFKTNHSALEQVAGTNVLNQETLMGTTWSNLYKDFGEKDYDDSYENKVRKEGKEIFMAACLIMGSNDSYF